MAIRQIESVGIKPKSGIRSFVSTDDLKKIARKLESAENRRTNRTEKVTTTTEKYVDIGDGIRFTSGADAISIINRDYNGNDE
jgi:hypothetical protein